jgi:hypothetical protein
LSFAEGLVIPHPPIDWIVSVIEQIGRSQLVLDIAKQWHATTLRVWGTNPVIVDLVAFWEPLPLIDANCHDYFVGPFTFDELVFDKMGLLV